MVSLIKGLPKTARDIYYKLKIATGRHDYLCVQYGDSDEKTYHIYIKKSDCIGNVDKRADPYKLYMFDQDSSAVARIYEASNDNEVDILAYNFASWNGIDEDDVVEKIVRAELHELTHWACECEGYEPESGGSLHNLRWRTVIEPLVEDLTN